MYFREKIDGKIRKLDPEFRRDVYVVICPKSSSHLIGRYTKNDRCKAGYKWTAYSTVTAKFREYVLIGNGD